VCKSVDGACRLYLCANCKTKIQTIETTVAIEDGMRAIDKLREYLITHKKPVTPTQLAKRFLISQTSVREALNKLEKEGHAKRKNVGQTSYWSYQAQPFDILAVPKGLDLPIRPPAPNRPIQNSYPTVRGYDD
jgi:transcription initiation factor IIE alpha subunit